MRRWVNQIRDEGPDEAFIPLEFALGEAAQVDWGEVVPYCTFDANASRHIFCASGCVVAVT